MTAFWIMTALATAMAALLVLTGARRGVDAVIDVEPDAAARELAELDRLKSRGLLTEEAWAAARAEAGRRLLATRTGPVELRARPTDRRWVLAGVVLTAVVALGLYWGIGKPGYGDQTYERRVDAWGASAEPLEAEQVAAVLTREAKRRPDDRQILTMLGASRFAAEDPVGAASAFRRALAIDDNDPRTWSRLGESLVRSQDGAVGADAEAAFREALKRDPGQLGALYFLGDAALRRGDRAGAATLWTPLIKALDPADPRRVDLEKRLASGGTGPAQ
jgi:cytochrome c-type biogenesis protein CcmH